MIWTWGDWELYSAQSEILEFLYNRQKFILDLNNRELDLLNRFIFFEDLCLGDLSLSFLFFLKFCLWWFVLWRLLPEIFPFEDLFRRFFLLWRCVHGDLSFEDLFKRIFISKIYVEDFFFEDLLKRFFIFEDLFRRFFLWRFWIGDLSLENLFM